MKRKTKILLGSYMLAALLALSLWALAGQHSLGWYRRAAETGAGLAFEETVRAVDDLATALDKSVYATDGAMADRFCAEIYARSAAAEAAMATLPFSTQELERLSAFLNVAGDYARSLCGQEAGFGAEQKEHLLAFSRTAGEFSETLGQLREALGTRDLRMDSREIRLENVSDPETAAPLSSRLLAYEAEFQPPETPDYDGRYGAAPLKSGGALTEEEMQRRAADFLGLAPEELQPAYSYEGAEGRRCFRAGDCWICASRRGVESVSQSRLVYEAKLSEDEGRAAAETLLAGQGYGELQLLSAVRRSAVLTLRFAPVLDGACCVDDPIEIAMALDDGSVYRFCAPENAPERAAFRLDAEAARAALPEGPVWGEAEKIIRRREGGRTLGCWRFQSATDDGRTLCIDVSAETGKEYDIRLS